MFAEALNFQSYLTYIVRIRLTNITGPVVERAEEQFPVDFAADSAEAVVFDGQH